VSKQTQTYIYISILAFLLGALAFYFVFGNKKTETINIPTTTFIEKASKPDTIYVDSFVTDTVWVAGSPDTIIVKQPAPISGSVDLDDDEQGSLVREPISRPVYVSYKDYRYGENLKPLKKFDKKYLVRNQVWAYSLSGVDSFQTKLEINWQDYYLTNVEPILDVKRLQSEYKGKFKGLIAGAVIAGGLFANEYYITVPAIVAGAAIFIYL